MSKIITEKKQIFKIPDRQKKERIDIFLSEYLEKATRSKVQKLIRAGFVTVNKNPVKPNYKISPGDIIKTTIPISPRPEFAEPENIPLNIIYEDEFLLVVNKDAGIVVHPACGNYTGTLVNALLFHTKQLSEVNEPGRPGIVHRLDKDTSGLLLIAKDDWTHAKLAEQFAKHTIEREYWAVCWGIFKDNSGQIIKNISRSESDRKKFIVSDTKGKYAYTIYEVIEEFEFTSLVRVNLKTGRTHQIRVHLSSIHHPVFSDSVYGGKKIVCGSALPKMKTRVDNLFKIMQRQALHAKTIGFLHPHKKEFMRFDSELPQDMLNLIEKLRY
ncbi:MAG TPA: RluA family pseudouridine synthase [Ignavibacteria bacterium]|nr:RluA family pseudouridine synthase [Ignavibacteria bacterium]